MDIELSADQELLDSTLQSFFADHAGPARAHQLGSDIDTALVERLDAAGYLDIGYEAGPIEAVLFAERAAEAVVHAPVIARALVAPLADIRDLPPLVGLVGSENGLVRYAGSCDAYLVLDGAGAGDGRDGRYAGIGTGDGRARLAGRDDVDVEPVRSRSAYPMGRLRIRRSEALAPGTGDALRRAWQVAIAAEIGALAAAAVALSARHVTDRHQFDRPIGSFQAVQHRLARSYSMAQASRWLARRGAWHSGDEFVTASAATFACLAARETYDNTHQVTGAIGITTEYGLVAFTTRLLALYSELGGAPAHARNVARARRVSTFARAAEARPD